MLPKTKNETWNVVCRRFAAYAMGRGFIDLVSTPSYPCYRTYANIRDDRLVMKSYTRAKGIEVYDTKQNRCFYLALSTG